MDVFFFLITLLNGLFPFVLLIAVFFQIKIILLRNLNI